MTAKKSAAKRPKHSKVGRKLLDALESLTVPEAIEAMATGEDQPGSSVRVLPPVPPESPESIRVRKLREELRMSQAAFARALNVSIQTVQAWEQGRNPPSGIAARFLEAIRDDLPYWREKLASPKPS